MKKKEELKIVATGDMNKIASAVKNHAFSGGTQIALLAPEYRKVLDLYLTLRKPCREFVKIILTSCEDLALIEPAVVGNSLSEENELLLVEKYPHLVEKYLGENPSGPYLCEKAYEVAVQNDTLAGVVKKRPECKPAMSSMGSLFSPELLAKLGVA